MYAQARVRYTLPAQPKLNLRLWQFTVALFGNYQPKIVTKIFVEEGNIGGILNVKLISKSKTKSADAIFWEMIQATHIKWNPRETKHMAKFLQVNRKYINCGFIDKSNLPTAECTIETRGTETLFILRPRVVTPLVYVSEISNECLINELLKNGADPNLTGQGSKTALAYANKFHRIESILLLIRYGAVIEYD